jgi:hypothetical protein
VTAPYVVAWLQEDAAGAVFLAPLDGGDTVANGDTVTIELRTWTTGDGGTFTGVVGSPEMA